MYVRWQSRKRRTVKWWQNGTRRKDDMHWSAILVENVRIKGKPTQRHVAYLGGITESAIALDKPAQRIYFWNGVERKLAALKLSAKERAAIMQTIAKRVPRVTSKQRQQLDRWLSANGLPKAGDTHVGS
jgi:hypothetical protein